MAQSRRIAYHCLPLSRKNQAAKIKQQKAFP
jgi:hypothetical protein